MILTRTPDAVVRNDARLTPYMGCDTFLEALGDPALHVRILDKVPATIEGMLQIAAPPQSGGFG